MNMSPELEAVLKGTGLLSDQELDLGTIDSGSYALNRIISGQYDGGYPIGGITEIIGESSVGKTGFLTHLFRNAQRLGYICALADNEFAYSPSFAEKLGVDGTKLAYFNPEDIDSAPKCFARMKEFILAVRKVDKNTPIVIALDSLATMQSEIEAEQDMDQRSNTDGMTRALEFGQLMRKFNPLLRKHKVCCVFINQYRAKPVLYGDPRTAAGGGRSLKYYCAVSLSITSNSTSDIVRGDVKQALGFKGTIKCRKNKVTIPYQECDFYFDYETGLDRYNGLASQLVKDRHITLNGAWYSIGDTKFQAKKLQSMIEESLNYDLDPIRDLLGIPLQSVAKEV